ncbi:MAG: N-acetyltransferase family protein [Acidobacteriota bacterium]
MRCKRNLAGVGDVDTPPGISLRTALGHDFHPLVGLDRECFGTRAWSAAEWWEAVVEPGWTTLVAERQGALIAAVVLLLWPPVASLASIAVHPAHRHRGLGRFLLRDALARARAAHTRWLTLEVDVSNHAAIRLYTDEGFGLVRRFREAGRRRLEMAHRLGRAGSR